MKEFLAVIVLIALFVVGLWSLNEGNVTNYVSETQVADIPEATGHVNDYAEILSPEIETVLEAELKEFPHEIAVLTVKSMNGLSIEEFGIKVGDKWKVGDAAEDDGVILIVSTGERKVRIEVGSGAEAVLNDAKAGRILDEFVLPSFKAGDWEVGIVSGIEGIKAAFK